MIETDSAWCICSHVYGETSCWVILFTKKRGMVSALFKGGRTPKKKALIHPFGKVWVSLGSSRNTLYLRQIEEEQVPFLFNGQQLFSGLYINELLYHGLRHDDPCNTLFEAYEQALTSLEKASRNDEIEITLRRFEMIYLAQMGYAITFAESSNGAKIMPDTYYSFYSDRGFVISKEGFIGADLIAIANDNFEAATTRLTAKKIMRKGIATVLAGKKIYSRSLFV